MNEHKYSYYLELSFFIYYLKKNFYKKVKFIIMIDQLFNLIKNQIQDNAHNSPQDISAHLNDDMYTEAHDVIVNGIQNMDQNSLGSLMNYADNDQLDANTPEVNNLAQQFSGNITQKLGIDSGLAKTIAIAIIPLVLKKLFSGRSNSNANDNAGGFSLDGILGGILGGNNSNTSNSNGGIMGKLSDIGAKLGLDRDGDGDVDLNDITGMLKK